MADYTANALSDRDRQGVVCADSKTGQSVRWKIFVCQDSDFFAGGWSETKEVLISQESQIKVKR